ncbi:conserved hypothetical protein [Ramlibacter tataouinensis TTB310]|uniref:Cytoskeleton protein RodZ-like C-terminal domain-containing protein n=2 Tax=Ramlibacter tataouinensis TaxID=94132 RepID=F5XX40_RAMTT|nr:conserved hypothetical protein [Ramlibacter tataouinensis TTB310]
MEAVSAGTLLRRAREAAGLHVAALAVSLKVPVRKLEALEEDRFDLLPEPVFARALACSVCRALKIDPQPVLDRLPQSSAPWLVQDNPGLNAPFRAPGDPPGPAWWEQLTNPVFLSVAALLLGALILLLLPVPQREQAAPAPGPLAAAPVKPPAAAQPAVQTVSVVAQGEAPQADRPAAASNAQPSVPAAAVMPAIDKVAAPAAAVPVAVVPAVTAAALPASVPAKPVGGLVAFRAAAPSWIQVVDANGSVRLNRLLAGGESAGISSGALPLAVTVGSASTIEVLVRGKPFDVARLAQEGVARFEVK